MRQIILASASVYRQIQLKQLGLAFEAHDHGIDESAYKLANMPVEQLVSRLSQVKAEALATQYPNALLIGGDQVAEIDGKCLEKPGNIENARHQLQLLSGRTHYLWSGVAVCDSSRCVTKIAVEKHAMTMRQLSPSQIDNYLRYDRAWDCVGAYKIESQGIGLFASIEGCDHTAIMGLPLIHLVSLLTEFGLIIP